MPKVTGPLFSLRASGTLARSLTYEDGGARQRVRRLPSSTPARSPLQTTYVEKVRQLAATWRHLDNTTKTLWHNRALDFALNGYALWWREWIAQDIATPDIPTLP